MFQVSSTYEAFLCSIILKGNVNDVFVCRFYFSDLAEYSQVKSGEIIQMGELGEGEMPNLG